MTIQRALTLTLLSLAAFTLLAQPAAQAPPAAAARENGLYAKMETSMGLIVIKLFEKEAPITVRNFVNLAQGRKAFRDPQTGQMLRRPFYNGIAFHRVIPGFMVQGGDPTGAGTYDAGFVIPDEFSPDLKFDVPGRLAMANAGPKTGSCQFFLTEVPTPHLNGHHTIFGQAVEGQDLIGKIARVPRDANDKPRTPVKIVKLTIERVGPAPTPPPPAKPPAAKKSVSKK